jgi:hypothetical protein
MIEKLQENPISFRDGVILNAGFKIGWRFRLRALLGGEIRIYAKIRTENIVGLTEAGNITLWVVNPLGYLPSTPYENESISNNGENK